MHKTRNEVMTLDLTVAGYGVFHNTLFCSDVYTCSAEKAPKTCLIVVEEEGGVVIFWVGTKI